MDWVFTTVGAVAFAATGVAAVASEPLRSWAAAESGRAGARWLGVFGVLVGGGAAGAFSSSPPLGVVLFFVAGVLAFAAGVLASAGAASVALAAAGAAFSDRVRAFWYATAVQFRTTRYAFAVASVAFLLAAVTGGVAVDPVLSAVGAVGFGGLLACIAGFAAVGAFVPTSRNEDLRDAVERAS